MDSFSSLLLIAWTKFISFHLFFISKSDLLRRYQKDWNWSIIYWAETNKVTFHLYVFLYRQGHSFHKDTVCKLQRHAQILSSETQFTSTHTVCNLHLHSLQSFHAIMLLLYHVSTRIFCNFQFYSFFLLYHIYSDSSWRSPDVQIYKSTWHLYCIYRL